MAKWYNKAWLYRKQITFSESNIDEDLVGLPVRLTFQDDPSLLAYAQNHGEDVLFTDENGNKLSHQTINFNKLLKRNVAWTVHNRFESVHYKGTHDRTYVCQVNSAGDMMIGQFDHDTKAWSEFTLKAAYEADDHSNPTITVLDDGTLMVFYSEHAGSTAFYRKSTNPEDISSWQAEVALGLDTEYTYVRPYKMGARMYLMWRGPAVSGARSTKMTWSDNITDASVTWASAVSLVTVASSDPYVHASVDVENSKIYIAFHPDNLKSAGSGVSDIYTGVITNTAGTNSYADMAGTPVVLPFAAANSTKAYDSVGTNDKGQIINIHHNSGLPVILFGKYVSDQEQRLMYGRWTGSAWVNTEIANMGEGIGGSTTQGHYTGSAYLDTIDPKTVYYSAVSNDIHRLFKAYTIDNGTTWIATQISSGNSKNFRPVVPQNRHNTEMQVFWLNGPYIVYTKIFTNLQCYPNLGSYLNAEFAVKVDLAAKKNTRIYMYYGNKNADDQQDAANVFGSDTIFSLAGDGSYTAKGLVDLRNLTALTVIVGFYVESTVTANDEYFASNFQASGSAAMFFVRKSAAVETLTGSVRMSTGSSVTAAFTDLNPAEQARHGVAIQFDQAGDGLLEGFLDGVKSAESGAATNAIHGTASNKELYTAVSPHALTKFLQGYVDWIVLSNIAKSDPWIKASTINLGSESTFRSIGSEERAW